MTIMENCKIENLKTELSPSENITVKSKQSADNTQSKSFTETEIKIEHDHSEECKIKIEDNITESSTFENITVKTEPPEQIIESPRIKNEVFITKSEESLSDTEYHENWDEGKVKINFTKFLLK